jgi:hypothetical protein
VGERTGVEHTSLGRLGLGLAVEPEAEVALAQAEARIANEIQDRDARQMIGGGFLGDDRPTAIRAEGVARKCSPFSTSIGQIELAGRAAKRGARHQYSQSMHIDHITTIKQARKKKLVLIGISCVEDDGRRPRARRLDATLSGLSARLVIEPKAQLAHVQAPAAVIEIATDGFDHFQGVAVDHLHPR